MKIDLDNYKTPYYINLKPENETEGFQLERLSEIFIDAKIDFLERRQWKIQKLSIKIIKND